MYSSSFDRWIQLSNFHYDQDIEQLYHPQPKFPSGPLQPTRLPPPSSRQPLICFPCYSFGFTLVIQMEPYCRAGSFSESSFLRWHNTLATHPCCWVYQNSTPFHCGIAFHRMELTDETLREYTFSSKEKPWTLQVLFLSFFFHFRVNFIPL